MRNKRWVLFWNHIQQQHKELEQQNKRNRSQRCQRRAQKTAIQQRNLNPGVLTWKCLYRTFLFVLVGHFYLGITAL